MRISDWSSDVCASDLGVFGVLAGLEVIRTLNDNGIETAAPVEVAVWTNEEGSRFAPAMIASGVFAGVFDLDYGHSRKDVDGRSIGERSEERRVGNECVRTWRSRWSP